MRAKGHSVILISHNLQDVFAVADRIQVLRLGRRVGVVEPRSHSMNDVVAMITGSSVRVGDSMIWAYPGEVTISRQLILHVSTTAAAFRVDAYRQGAELEFVGCLGDGLRGFNLPFGGATSPWAWPSYAFKIDQSWRPGVYVAVLTPLDAAAQPLRTPDPTDLAATWGKALFIVEGVESAPIIYKLPTFTYHAYNGTGYGSLYAEAIWSRSEPRGFRATMQRPGGGVGGIRYGRRLPRLLSPGVHDGRASHTGTRRSSPGLSALATTSPIAAI